MDRTETEQRKAFQRQPARAILLDLCVDSYTCLNIQEALSSTLSIMLQLQGAPRLTHLSLILLGDHPKCMFPLQAVKGNMQRINVALKAIITQEVSVSVSLPNSCVIEGLQECLAQFQRLTQNSKQTINVPSQIEVTLLTGRDEQSIRKMLITSSEQMNLEHLRKITAVCVSDPDRVMSERAALLNKSDGDAWTKDESLSQMTSSQAELGMSMLDIVRSENDPTSLCNVFKHWLLDCSTDTEHLKLSLPACLGDTPIILKCDLQERLINPACLPGAGEKFVLNTGSGAARPLCKVSNATTCPPLPLYKLRAEALVEPEGVCESVLFGMPITMRPTACWRLDWEELENNQNHFSALCRMLQQKDKYLLTLADTLDTETKPRFLILPSPPPSLSLMIKSIAVQELMMPSDVLTTEEEPSQAALKAVDHCLDMLQTKQCYNPLTVQSNLYTALTSNPNNRGSLSTGHRAFTGGFKDSTGFSGKGPDSRSLGPRKQYSSATRYSRKQ